MTANTSSEPEAYAAYAHTRLPNATHQITGTADHVVNIVTASYTTITRPGTPHVDMISVDGVHMAIGTDDDPIV